MKIFDFLYKDITICIFDDRRPKEDPTIAFLVKIRKFDPESTNNGGVVYSQNPYKNTYHQELTDDNRILDGLYHIARRKILSADFMKLGYEGRILNAPKNS